MLSSVLNNERAVQVNIAIMRVSVKLREMLSAQKGLAFKLRELERKVSRHDVEIQAVFKAVQKLMSDPGKNKKPIGFRIEK